MKSCKLQCLGSIVGQYTVCICILYPRADISSILSQLNYCCHPIVFVVVYGTNELASFEYFRFGCPAEDFHALPFLSFCQSISISDFSRCRSFSLHNRQRCLPVCLLFCFRARLCVGMYLCARSGNALNQKYVDMPMSSFPSGPSLCAICRLWERSA